MPKLPKRSVPRKSWSSCERMKDKAYKQGERMRHTAAWLNMRKRHLALNPLCVHCQQEGRYTQATDVDHIIPHKGDYNLFFDTENLQSLCKSCHSRKTLTEDMSAGRYVPDVTYKRERL
jgi:5-methylcytosine-specific restriction protein A